MDRLRYNLACLFWALVMVSPIIWIMLMCL
jgi:hypothetical protein